MNLRYLIIPFVFLATQFLQAQNEILGTLQEIKEIEVIVDLPQEVHSLGFFPSDFQAEIELKCRLAGLKISKTAASKLEFVVTVDEARLLKGCANRTWYVFSFFLSVKEQVELTRRSTMVINNVSVWHDSYLGYFSDDKALEAKNLVNPLITKFINDWLRDNPK